MTEAMQTCTKCGEPKPATAEFFYSEPRFGSLRSHCKQCCRQAGKQHYAEHPGHKQEYYEVHRDAKLAALRQLRADNPRMDAESHRKYRDADPEKCAGMKRRWQVTNPGKVIASSHRYRARRAGSTGTHTAEDVQAQYARQHGRCFWCHEKVTDYHVDHVVPLILGGSNGPENLVIACPHCNISKRDKHPMDFAGRML
jgi:5-methylcytosine-specific restriction endonuclease McrA